MRAVSDDDAVILIVSPKFATVHDHVSFQWSLKIHGTTGREDDPPSDYVAVELYFVDGPVSQVRSYHQTLHRKLLFNGNSIAPNDHCRGCFQDNVDNVVKVSVLIKMDAKLFDPYTYLDKVSPTPHKSFLTTNYNARVNSKVWRRRSRNCCESCERRRASFAYSKTEDEAEDGEVRKLVSFEYSYKTFIFQLLANMYFNKIVLPGMEYVEDFVDFLIDAELNDLPVLKRACERYLCGELNTKKDLLTSLLLDLLFISIVFQLPVMKSMTLSELSNRTEELSQPDKLMEDDEYKVLDKRVRSLSDRNLVELIEQCVAFAEQRNRVQVITLSA
ncbi:unnamed protein product [Haemonchus placei]|uniref:BTB domain-containing protein n=1 Tax=Haemonchus placei TaxID=6290 RepID=A0A0N4W394_HAEPC|nr:unnamed protein product [Haemonchus placei]